MALAPGRWHTQSSSKATNRWGDFIWLWPEGVCRLTRKPPYKDPCTNTRPLLHLHVYTRSFSRCLPRAHTYTCTPGMSQGWRGARGIWEGQTFPQVSDCHGSKWAAQNNRLAPLTLNLIRIFHPRAEQQIWLCCFEPWYVSRGDNYMMKSCILFQSIIHVRKKCLFSYWIMR